MSENSMAIQLISDPLILQSLVRATIEAGRSTTESERTKRFKHSFCVLPLNFTGINREIKPFVLHVPEAEIEYRWQDITVVGGAVINALNILAQQNLGNYFTQLTPDIDIVWWPALPKGLDKIQSKIATATFLEQKHFVQYPPYVTPFDTVYSTFFDESIRTQQLYVPVSSSAAIIALTHEMTVFLSEQLNALFKNKDFRNRIENVTGYHVNQMKFTTESTLRSIGPEMYSSIKSGSWNIKGFLHIGKMALKLLDITIHDSASSQKSNAKILEDPTADPIYVNVDRDLILHLRGLLHIPFFPIPRLNIFVYQQFYGLINRMKDYRERKITHEKVEMHHRRIQYIRDLFGILYDNMKYVTHNNNGIADVEFYKTPYTTMLLDYFEMGKLPASYFFENLSLNIPSHPDWIASCPWNLDRCSIPHNSPTLKELCAQDKMFHKSLCPSFRTPTTTSRSGRSKSPKARTPRTLRTRSKSPSQKGTKSGRKSRKSH